MKRDYALFRYPGGKEDCYLVESDTCKTVSTDTIEKLAGMTGFVFAPFESSSSWPLLFLPGEKRRIENILEVADINIHKGKSADENRRQYAEDYKAFHEAILSGKVNKAVLARSCMLEMDDMQDLSSLFRKACLLYPDSFVALIVTAASGTWLMATPEVLLEKTGERWHTMALAGTMTEQETEKNNWSEKNMAEQRYVALYIKEMLKGFADGISEVGPLTVKAGCVSHLRTDFFFDMKESAAPCSLVSALHPTPAVCGLPKVAAWALIRNGEHLERKYYSGFSGFVGDDEFRLYVTLRCMNIRGNKAELFAGGGIMADSKEEDEWKETQRKMSAMRNVLGI